MFDMKWNANPIISRTPDGFTHVECPIWADSVESAKEGAEYILNTFASGKGAFIRRRPESWTDREFDTEVTRYLGSVRFSFRDEPGEWHYSTEPSVDEVEDTWFW